MSFAPETKYFDCGINTAVTFAGTDWSDTEVPCDNYINSSGAAAAYTDSALIPSANGSAYGQVNGNRYKLKKLRIRGNLSATPLSDSADASTGIDCRVLLIHDTQPNGTQAQGEDVMQDFGAVGENLFSFKRVSANSGRFRIIKDEWINLKVTNSQTDGASTGSIAFATEHFSMQYVPKKAITVNIKSGNATPTIGGLVDNNFFLLLAGTRAGAAQEVIIRAASRAYYCD